MRESDAQFVGDIPANYDAHLGPVLFEAYADDLARRAARGSPARVLELAAGTGILTERLHGALGEIDRFVVTDLNAPMLEIARTKLPDAAGAKFTACDAAALDFPDDAFDLVACQFGVMFFPDRAAAYREALRVLEPGGRYVFNSWAGMEDNPFTLVAQAVMERVFPDYPPAFMNTPFGYADPETIAGDLEAAGFAVAGSETVAVDSPVESWESFARGLVHGNPTAEEVRSRGGTDPDDLVAALAGALRADFGPEPGTVSLKAHVVEAEAPS
ncbi:methyltransferase type 11 [Marinicauda salina]|uniref:Methyltransferase type 11 n=1 Tax=Marinicauda salina TaxID=2135793 RepID=A0A2U2BRR0_9PROT|nr:methyltransferase domain-containing protein [Marinicauda salina]PWE16668.1 methyltransferase type 11 [Marinicauda salina]